MNNRAKLAIIFGIGLALSCSVPGYASAEAQVGVGIMPGIIRVDRPLFPGGKYQLSSLQVVNTGSDATRYELVTVKMARQTELQPPAEYITFNPKSFELASGANQVITLGLDIPTNAAPGDYLAYVEAHPVAQSASGTSIGVAAATKIYFTVQSASVFQTIAFATIVGFNQTAPYSYFILGIAIVASTFLILKRYIKLEMKLSRKGK